MKKLRFILLSLVVLLTSGRAAAYDFESGGFYYNIIDAAAKTVEVTCADNQGFDTQSSYTGDVIIQSTVTYGDVTYSVIRIGQHAFRHSSITSLTISEGIETIDDYACSYNEQLQLLSLPSTLKSIGYDGFEHCIGLTSVSLPEGLQTVGGYAFNGCYNVRKLELPSTLIQVDWEAFNGMYSLAAVISHIEVPFNIQKSAFGNREWNDWDRMDVYSPSSATLYVPAGTTSLYQATEGWSMFDDISEGEPVLEQADNGFWYSYTSGETTAKLVYGGYTNLGNLTLSGTVSLGGKDFTVKAIGYRAFYNANIDTLIIGEGIEKIYKDAFRYNYDMRSVTLPSTLRTIGCQSFYNCGISNLDIPEGVMTIEYSAFRYSSIRKVVLPSTLITIGGCAFFEMSNLNSVVSRIAEPDSISQSVFAASASWSNEEQKYYFTTTTAKLYVPTGTSDKYKTEDGWKDFSDITEGEPKETTVDGLNYSYVEGKSVATVIGRTNKERRTVTIPGTVSIDGANYAVTVIGIGAFYDDTNIDTLIIQPGVETISKNAFQYCYNMKSITIPEGVKTIGENAFRENGTWSPGLKTITLPSTLDSIGNYAFYWCSNLTSVISRIAIPFEINKSVFALRDYYYDSSGNYVSDFAKSPATLYVPVGTKSAYEAFGGWTMFDGGIYEGEPKEGVGNDGFNYMYLEESKRATLIKGEYSSMREVSIPATTVIGGATYNVVGIASNVFENMSVRSVKIAEGVETIGSYAFRWCHSLTSVSLPGSITSIGNQAFYECSQLDTISIPRNVETIGDNAFQYCRIKEVIIPATTKSIGNNAFYNCNYITTIQVDAGNTVYDSRNNCNALIETTSNKLIKGSSSTVIPNSVVEIGYEAFGYLSGLTGITIPNSVTRIESGAFYSCSGLTSIYIPSSVEYIGSEAFGFCTSLNSIKVDQNNSVFDSRNDCNAIVETNTNKLVVGCAKTTIPRGVKIIGSSAFRGCSGIDSLRIVGGVETIEYQPFDYSGLSYVEIPNSIKNIGNEIFWGCTKLSTIVSKIKDPSSINIEENAFEIGGHWVNGNLIVLTDVATLYVPKGKKELYQQTSPWRNFVNIEEMDGDPLATPTLAYDGRAVTATSTDSDVEMYYSTDGSEPNTYYEGPIPVSDLGTVKVMAEKTFRSDSEIASYEIKYLYTGDTLKVSEAGLMAEAIKWCGNDSVVKMTVVGPINATEFETIRTLPNLKFLNLAEAQIEGLAIPDNAFANSNIVSFVAPSSLASVGSGIFSGCQQLAAVDWATDKALPADALNDVSNPNLLLYLKTGSTAPAGINNVIIDGKADLITLVDATGNNNFYCPVPFSAKRITYTRNFQQKTEVGVSRGWETIVLPFNVDSITHEKFGKDTLLIPFSRF